MKVKKLSNNKFSDLYFWFGEDAEDAALVTKEEFNKLIEAKKQEKQDWLNVKVPDEGEGVGG